MIARTLPGEEAANNIRQALGKANDAGAQNGFISTCLAPLKTWPLHNWPNWKNVVYCSHGYRTYLQIS